MDDNFLKVFWEKPACTTWNEPYLEKQIEAYVGTYDIGLGELRRNCLIFMIHKDRNTKGKYVDGEKRSLSKSQMYEEFRNRPSILQFVRRVRLDEKPVGFPHKDEKWGIIFDHADITLKQYFLQGSLWTTMGSNFLISTIRAIFMALSDLHSLGYLLCRATPSHFVIQFRKNAPLRICIADMDQLIKPDTKAGHLRQIEFMKDFIDLEYVVIFILTGKWKTQGCEQLLSPIADSFITSLKNRNYMEISSALKHPLFWDSTRLIAFYAGTSEFLKLVGPPLTLKQAFEVVGLKLFANHPKSVNYDWKNTIDPDDVVIKTMEQASNNNKKYDTTNVIELIRLIRNMHNHPNGQLKDLFTDEEIAKYIELHVPKLTMSIYFIMYKRYNGDKRFNHYFF